MEHVKCATYEGIEVKVVEVESSLTKGLPSFNIVGIASTSINESKDRFALSFRAIKKVQKVARTIADLDQSQIIGKKDIL